MERTRDFPAVNVLVLARLLPPGEKGETRDRIAKDLKPLLQHRWEGQAGADRIDRALCDLQSGGMAGRIGKGKAERFALTPDGRRLGLEALGLEELPPRTTWAKLKSSHLLALAVGRAGSSGADLKRISGAPGLKAELLRSHYKLGLGDRPTLKQAGDALAGVLLGLEPGQSFTTDGVLRALLSREGIALKPGQKPGVASIQEAVFRRELGDLSAKKPLDGLATRSVGARQSRASELSEAAIRTWLDRSEEASGTEESAAAPADGGGDSRATPLDLGSFARLVLDAARASPSGWFGDGKVFIAHVWRAARDAPAFRGMDADAFKARLIDAHRARWLELGRGDLVEAMDPGDVRESATPYMNAVYHFVRVEEEDR